MGRGRGGMRGGMGGLGGGRRGVAGRRRAARFGGNAFFGPPRPIPAQTNPDGTGPAAGGAPAADVARPLAVVDRGRCTGCAACVQVCPNGAITMEDEKAVVRADLCTGCAACVRSCPQDAIAMQPRGGA